MLSTMERNRKILNDEIATITYYMNGGISYNDAWLLTFSQRKSLGNVIEKHYKAMDPNKKGGNIIG